MLTKNIVAACVMLVGWFPVCGQDWTKATQSVDRSLKVGDRVPFKKLNHIINYPKKELILSEHKAKLIILDFWGTKCTPCVQFWPNLLRLQKEFAKDLQVILVDKYEDEKTVTDFISKRKRIAGVEMTLPVSCSDTTLFKLFPQNDVPRYVWITSNGTIGGITRSGDLTSANISRWISSGPFPLNPTMEKEMFSAAMNEPIFVNGNGGIRPSDVFLWTSSLTKGQRDLGAESKIFYQEGFGYGITATNNSITNLYATAYNNQLREFDYFDFLPHSRTELIATDTTKFYRGKNGENVYNYQLLSGKPKTREELLMMMKEDLRRYFGLDVKWEKRIKKSVVLTMYDSNLAKRPSLGAEIRLRDMDIIIDSAYVKDITTYLEIATSYRRKRFPIVDETNYKGFITGIRDEGSVDDLVQFDKVLSKYGMHIRFELREVDVLVLKEPTH